MNIRYSGINSSQFSIRKTWCCSFFFFLMFPNRSKGAHLGTKKEGPRIPNVPQQKNVFLPNILPNHWIKYSPYIMFSFPPTSSFSWVYHFISCTNVICIYILYPQYNGTPLGVGVLLPILFAAVPLLPEIVLSTLKVLWSVACVEVVNHVFIHSICPKNKSKIEWFKKKTQLLLCHFALRFKEIEENELLSFLSPMWWIIILDRKWLKYMVT